MIIFVFLLLFVFTIIISYLWVGGIDRMKNDYPDYKGLDLFNEENEKDNIHK